MCALPSTQYLLQNLPRLRQVGTLGSVSPRRSSWHNFFQGSESTQFNLFEHSAICITYLQKWGFFCKFRLIQMIENYYLSNPILKPYLFAHPNPIKVIISWIISWQTIAIFLTRGWIKSLYPLLGFWNLTIYYFCGQIQNSTPELIKFYKLKHFIPRLIPTFFRL